jgi:hypothetical protein
MSMNTTSDLEIGAVLKAGFSRLKSDWYPVLIKVGIPYFLVNLVLWGILGWWGYQVFWPIMQSAFNGEKPQIDYVHAILPYMAGMLVLAYIPLSLIRAALYRYRAGEGLKGQFFAFRFGADEGRQYLANWLVLIIVFVIPLAGFAALISLAGVIDAPWFKIVLIMTAIIDLPLIMIALGVRFSLIYAQTFTQKRVVFWQSWSLTRGHLWVLLLSFSVLIIFFGMISLIVTTPANILFYAQQATGWIGDPEILKNMDPADIRVLMYESLLSQKTVIAVAWMILAGTVISIFRFAVFAGASLFAVQTINQKAPKRKP